MVRTLQKFLMRELLRVSLLALIAFTMVPTIFAVIEPLRKEGLSYNQLLPLVSYTVPMTLSWTLPVAVLFAATIVYGRFAQDNEYLACRASGISTFSLLKPAIALGLLVTVAVLLLGNFATPYLLAKGKRTVMNNLTGIIYNQLRTKNYFRQGQYVVHADQVEQDELQKILRLRGVVVFNQERDAMQVVVSPTASVRLDTIDGENYASVHLLNPVVTSTASRNIVQEGEQPVEYIALPHALQEDPSWYNWYQLGDMLKDPTGNSLIRDAIGDIRRAICKDMTVQEIITQVNRGHAYTLRSKDPRQAYKVTAASAVPAKLDSIRLSASADGVASPQMVEVKVYEDDKESFTVTARSGKIETGYDKWTRQFQMTLKLTDDVTVRPKNGSTIRPAEWIHGQVCMPADIMASTSQIPLKDLCDSECQLALTRNNSILNAIDYLKNRTIRKLSSRIIAEMHSRIAFSLSCFLLVSVGAALGLMSRGGQIISAFAVCVGPGLIAALSVLMGKEMLRNPDISRIYGLIAIWSGLVILTVATVVVYARLLRR